MTGTLSSSDNDDDTTSDDDGHVVADPSSSKRPRNTATTANTITDSSDMTAEHKELFMQCAFATGNNIDYSKVHAPRENCKSSLWNGG